MLEKDFVNLAFIREAFDKINKYFELLFNLKIAAKIIFVSNFEILNFGQQILVLKVFFIKSVDEVLPTANTEEIVAETNHLGFFTYFWQIKNFLNQAVRFFEALM